jgi:hypothetical protein
VTVTAAQCPTCRALAQQQRASAPLTEEDSVLLWTAQPPAEAAPTGSGFLEGFVVGAVLSAFLIGLVVLTW